MSMEHTGTVTCPDCGTESDFIIWQSVNTQLDPDTKQKVLSGELFRFKCPKCGSEHNIVYPMLYHQMEDQIMIHLVTSDEDVAEATDSFDKISSGTMLPGANLPDFDYTFRIVGSQNELREKIYIFDQGLDDRVIEMVKLCLKSYLMVNKPELKVDEILLEIRDGAPEEFAIRLEDRTWRHLPYRPEIYEQIKQDMLDPSDDGKKIYFVDQKWALEHMEPKVS